MLVINIMIMISTHSSSSWFPSWWRGSSSSTLQRPCWPSPLHQRLQEYRDFCHVGHKHTSDHDLNSHSIIITKIMMTTTIIIKITSSLKSSWIGASSTRLLGSSTPCNILINIFFITALQSVNIFISLPRKQSIYVCENQYTSNLSLNTDLINWLLAHCSIFSIFLYFQLFFRIFLFLSILQKFSVFFSIFLACSDLVSML